MLTALFATLVAMLVFADARAQVRGPSVKEVRERVDADPAIARAAKLAELDAWLRRLVGRYAVSGSVGMPYRYSPVCRRNTRCQEPALPPNSGFKGLADCTRIGDGPGVHCLVNITGIKGRQYRIYPKAMLYGIDPDALGIRYLQVNGESIAEGDIGTLAGDSVSFRFTCPIVRMPMYNTLYCHREVRIQAAPDGKRVEISTRTDEPSGPLMGLPVIGQGPIVEEMQLRRLP